MRVFLFMKFLEKDLEEIIYTSGRDVLEQRGLIVEGKLFRQLKIGNYGIADLISVTRPCYDFNHEGKRSIFVPGMITIYELKKDQVGISAFLQSMSYLKGIIRYLQKRGKDELFEVNICIIGKTIDTTGAFCFIPDLLSITNMSTGHIEFMTYDFNIDGIKFHRGSFERINDGF